MNKLKKGDKVRFIDGSDPREFTVFGYANPDYDDTVWLTKGDEIITTKESLICRIMNSLEYREFSTTPEYDKSENLFHGHLEGIRSLVTWESDSLEGCKQAFESTVDEYINFCKELNIDPNY